MENAVQALSASQFMQNKLGISLGHRRRTQYSITQTAHTNRCPFSIYDVFNANLIFHIMQNILVGHNIVVMLDGTEW